MTMYESPIKLIRQNAKTQIEDGVFKAVTNIGIDVDKGELIRALSYDREQYIKGYQDALASYSQVSKVLCGKDSATLEELLQAANQLKSPWISVKEGLPEPFISVLCYMPGESPCPTVREGFLTNEGVWYAGMFNRDPDEVVMWRPMPMPPKEGLKEW